MPRNTAFVRLETRPGGRISFSRSLLVKPCFEGQALGPVGDEPGESGGITARPHGESMSSPQPIANINGNLLADASGSFKMRMVGPWMLAAGASDLQTGLDIQAIEAEFQARVRWRTADVDTNFPNAWQNDGTVRSADGGYQQSFDISAEQALWVQPGVATKLNTGSNPETMPVRLWATAIGGGFIVGRQRIHIEQDASGVVVPIGNPFAAAGVTGLMWGLIYSGMEGNVTSPTPVWRPYKTGDLTSPEAWESGTAGSTVGTDQRVNMVMNTTTSDQFMMQAGFKYSSSSTQQGTIDILIAAKLS